MRTVMVVLLASLFACGGTSPVAPTQPTQPESFDFMGRWGGSITMPGGGCWEPGTCDRGDWTLFVNLDHDNFVWAERCPFACSRFNTEREGSFTISDRVVITFTEGSAELFVDGDCLAGTITLPSKTGTVRICR